MIVLIHWSVELRELFKTTQFGKFRKAVADVSLCRKGGIDVLLFPVFMQLDYITSQIVLRFAYSFQHIILFQFLHDLHRIFREDDDIINITSNVLIMRSTIFHPEIGICLRWS